MKIYISYIVGMILNYINSILIGKVLPQSIRCKYNKLIMWLQLVH